MSKKLISKILALIILVLSVILSAISIAEDNIFKAEETVFGLKTKIFYGNFFGFTKSNFYQSQDFITICGYNENDTILLKGVLINAFFCFISALFFLNAIGQIFHKLRAAWILSLIGSVCVFVAFVVAAASWIHSKTYQDFKNLENLGVYVELGYGDGFGLEISAFFLGLLATGILFFNSK
ncbi:hypothetical protein M0811_00829 [Anaeramoeba ignava]|uniref:Uncharacterized protein n=1 Tax=Anaeramoeba ignava TaxID=1746090 RepID=A0A9Q0LKK8_ANAIG|nr:hypothetical protein M0811_00829 [Anaeramoeba ignava]